MVDVKKSMKEGLLYQCNDEKLMREQAICLDKLFDYNCTRPTEEEKRYNLLKEMCAEVGEGVYVEPPFRSNWGGKNVHFGKFVYANFNLTCVDDTDIYIGDSTLIGPNVVLATASHPICPEIREKVYQFNLPIKIGKKCWLGSGVIVLPGVSIGDNTVIGAGSIVTKDIPSNVVAVGNPCKVMREITKRDYEYYYKERKIPHELLRDI